MHAHQGQFWEMWSGLVHRQRGKAALHLWPRADIITFGELDEQARHWSEALRAQSLRAGERVLVRCGNRPAFIAVFLACSRFRLVMIPLEAKTTREQTHALANRFDARALVTPRGVVAMQPTTGKMSLPPPDTALLKLTSGSTGEPRGVAHSEATLAADCKNICETMAITPDDLNLAAISLAHSYGFSNLVLPLVTQGTSTVLLEEFVPRAVLDAIARTHATVFPAVPFMAECLTQISSLRSRIPNLRLCISAGAPLSPDIGKQFHERFGLKIHSFYGSSECGGITYDASDDLDALGEHVGTPMKNVQVDVVSVEALVPKRENAAGDSGHYTAAEGRVRVTSAAVGLGYWPAESKEDKAALRSGVFLTGDLGRFDDKGRLHLTGRVANFINVAGKKVNPAAIEDCIRQLDGVKQVVVLGAPDEQRGEQVVAFIVTDSAALTERGYNAEKILAHCRKTLADYQLPRCIEFLKELPLTERGKVAKQKLLELL